MTSSTSTDLRDVHVSSSANWTSSMPTDTESPTAAVMANRRQRVLRSGRESPSGTTQTRNTSLLLLALPYVVADWRATGGEPE
jgi:SMC interacting uncharacterized protein involved in chromosome segregation